MNSFELERQAEVEYDRRERSAVLILDLLGIEPKRGSSTLAVSGCDWNDVIPPPVNTNKRYGFLGGAISGFRNHPP